MKKPRTWSTPSATCLIDRIDAFLGYPATDPHGDPIPKADGTVAGSTGRSLSKSASAAASKSSG